MHVSYNARGLQDYKMVVVGHRAVGKSALVVRFLTNRFISEYQENSEMTCNGTVEVDGERMQLNIQDTSEKGIRLATIDYHFRAADAIMLVYSVTDKTSFQRLRSATTRLKQKLLEHELSEDKMEKVPALIVVGNKGDLEHSREVETDKGLELAQSLGCAFYETSASEGWSKLYLSKNPIEGKNQREGEISQRPTSLWSEKSSTVRRKSDPTLALHSIFSPTGLLSPENDMNNNDFLKKSSCQTPNVPRISISLSEEVPPVERTQSRGRKLMQKLSPRLSRKFGGGSKQDNSPKLSNIGAGLAKMSAATLAVGAMGRGNTSPARNVSNKLSRSPTSVTVARINQIRRPNTLKTDRTQSSSFSDSNCSSSSSSSESLVPQKENDIRTSLFFRAETPVSDSAISSSEEDDFIALSRSAIAATTSRRSRVERRERNLIAGGDTIRTRLATMPSSKRGHSETRVKSIQTNSNSVITSTTQKETGFKQKKHNASEPFKHLCRETRNARRMRDRITPTKFFRDGIRKIKTTFVSDQAHQNSYHYKNPHFQVTAVSR